MQRVAIYIDGFNLYFGMKQADWGTKWLDVEALSRNMLKAEEELISVKYFTARVKNNKEKSKRQSQYLDAIDSTSTEIIYGKYKSGEVKCNKCKHTWPKNEEKMTDVNISVHMLIDGMQDKYDKCIVISGDSDLTPPIRALKEHFPGKNILVAFPPERFANELKQAADNHFHIKKHLLIKSQFRDEIILPSSYILHKPSQWK